jgi:hypothetical protein
LKLGRTPNMRWSSASIGFSEIAGVIGGSMAGICAQTFRE